MRRFLFVILMIPGIAYSAGMSAPIPLLSMKPDLDDQASLQRGLGTFMNYCHGCHSLQYQRYVRTADDLGIPRNLMMEHVVFDPSVSIGDLMDNVMSEESAKLWFGAPPPDLTLYTKLKGGPDYLYTYMLNFYEDTAPLGRGVTIEEVGNTAAFLCSDLASGITGEITYVDGGFNTVGISPNVANGS